MNLLHPTSWQVVRGGRGWGGVEGRVKEQHIKQIVKKRFLIVYEVNREEN